MKIFEITFCGTCKLNCKSVTVDIKAGNMSKNVFKIVYDSFFLHALEYLHTESDSESLSEFNLARFTLLKGSYVPAWARLLAPRPTGIHPVDPLIPSYMKR